MTVEIAKRLHICKYIEGGGYKHHTFSLSCLNFFFKWSSRKNSPFAQPPGELDKHAEIIGNVDQCICSINTIWILEFGNQGSGISS